MAFTPSTSTLLIYLILSPTLVPPNLVPAYHSHDFQIRDQSSSQLLSDHHDWEYLLPTLCYGSSPTFSTKLERSLKARGRARFFPNHQISDHNIFTLRAVIEVACHHSSIVFCSFVDFQINVRYDPKRSSVLETSGYWWYFRGPLDYHHEIV